MPKTGPATELIRLKGFVRELEARYLSPYLGASTLSAPPRREVLDVAAFVVLTHGALENFVESLTLWIAGRIQSNWTTRRRVSRSTAALLLRTPCLIEEEENADTTFDTLRKALDAAKAARSHAVNANHGIALKHLRRLFSPLGVDIPADAVLIGSLESLVKMRHEWAHQPRSGATTIKAAGDVKTVADDCIKLAQQLAARVSALKL